MTKVFLFLILQLFFLIFFYFFDFLEDLVCFRLELEKEDFDFLRRESEREVGVVVVLVVLVVAEEERVGVEAGVEGAGDAGDAGASGAAVLGLAARAVFLPVLLTASSLLNTANVAINELSPKSSSFSTSFVCLSNSSSLTVGLSVVVKQENHD